MEERVKTRLREAAVAYKAAPIELRDAILEAADDGATDAEIAVEIDLTYSPDYVGRLIRKYRGPRKRGRRPSSES
ncbi:hypothetical protein [Actinomadura decatromicini]|uniref:Uncharacterized protein n=1 Tax=Actinomadura decatromicini TaxID=2604572 RepID=A0A5D3FAG2_9ACTN|nr:hypothetical protein [Actinomadura decatromicini]TYK45203.1 hypothetical protein FXF68_31490 [Actinomadura decatromicini]